VLLGEHHLRRRSVLGFHGRLWLDDRLSGDLQDRLGCLFSDHRRLDHRFDLQSRGRGARWRLNISGIASAHPEKCVGTDRDRRCQHKARGTETRHEDLLWR
jgi:hypothetical protein